MRFFTAILSLICAIQIIICSIVQFHHHNHSGEMMIYSYSKQYCDHHSHEHEPLIAADKCIGTHGCRDGHHQEEKNCSLKINIVNIEKKSIPHFIIAYFRIIDDIVADFTRIRNEFDIPKKHFFISGDYHLRMSLRAPPCA